jgi:hypothetical protein
MKLDALLERFPWHGTLEALCQEPPGAGSLPLTNAQELIEQQRESQLAVLSRMMYSPLLEGNYERAEDIFEPSDYRRTTSLRLRRPDQASRLFLAAAAQAGKALRPFGPERLSELGRDDAALGRLLRVLSVAQASPKRRAVHGHEWPEIARLGIEGTVASPFGIVLTPMIMYVEPEAWEVGHDIYPDPIWELSKALHKITSSAKLTDWTYRLVRAGAVRLRRLRGDERSTSLSADHIEQLLELKREGIQDPDVDLLIGASRDDSNAVRVALDAGANVNVTIGEVLRRYRSDVE